MILLYAFTFLAGITTILSPCIWPILPIIFITASGKKKKPIGITIGVALSFATLTLFLSYLLKIFSFDPIIFRYIAVSILLFLGLSLIVPQIMNILENVLSKFSSKFSRNAFSKGDGFLTGFVTGLALGIVWSPCAGPILATVATLASTQMLNSTIIIMMIIYTIGLSIPLFLLALLGNKFTEKVKTVSKHTAQIQKAFGVIVIIIAVLIALNLDIKLQAQVYRIFPNLTDITKPIENNEIVEEDLKHLHEELNEQEQTVVCENGKKCKAISKDLEVSGQQLEVGDQAPQIYKNYEWLNDDNSLKDTKPEATVVEFWSMDCVNCVDVIPHLNEFQDKYAQYGLVTVGIHTPEFKVEKNMNRLKNAIKRYNIKYPVIQDNEYEIWKAYKNRYWPTIYIIDKNGTITYIHEGRGDYDILEGEIRNTLNIQQ